MSEVGLFVLRAIVGGTIVATIGAIGRDQTGLGGVIATFPVMIFLSVILLHRDGATDETIATFSSSAGLALVPTALALGSMVLSLRAGQTTLIALTAALAIWCIGACTLTLIIFYR